VENYKTRIVIKPKTNPYPKPLTTFLAISAYFAESENVKKGELLKK